MVIEARKQMDMLQCGKCSDRSKNSPLQSKYMGYLTWIEREGGEEIPWSAPIPFFMELFQSCTAGSNFCMRLLKMKAKYGSLR